MAGPKKHPHWQQRLAFHRSRCQARRLGEPWAQEFTFEQWLNLWAGDWSKRGRGLRDLCMVRVDRDLPWHQDNVDICERREYLQPQGRYWRGGRWQNT